MQVAFAHAQNFATTIPTARLVELDAPTHLFWIGPSRARIQAAAGGFIAGRGRAPATGVLSRRCRSPSTAW